MQLINKSAFAAYELTAAEEVQGYTLNEANKAVIQNLISGYAEDLLLVRLDGQLGSVEEANKVAYTSGALDALRGLLNRATIIEENARQELQEKLHSSEG